MAYRFAVFSNNEKDPYMEYLVRVAAVIRDNGGIVVCEKSVEKNQGINREWIMDADIIISLGGDGTFLNIARQVYKSAKPILGINIGSLGFLSEIEIKDIGCSIKDLMAGSFVTSQRMMLQADISRNGRSINRLTALNDFVISRGEISRIVQLRTSINGCYVDTFPGDGVIVSTPTGSTGYSLSAGGPVIDHEEKLILITPICPHTMHARSFVASARSIVKIQVDERNEYECILTADGQKGAFLKGNDLVTITKSRYTSRMIKMKNNNFFNTLRNKIYNRS
jgi:NAD+ kinase